MPLSQTSSDQSLQVCSTVTPLPSPSGGTNAWSGTVTTQAAVSSPGVDFQSNTGGDGWDVGFHADGQRVFNVFHHDVGMTVDCHIKSTGDPCNAHYPWSGTTDVLTSQQPYLLFDPLDPNLMYIWGLLSLQSGASAAAVIVGINVGSTAATVPTITGLYQMSRDGYGPYPDFTYGNYGPFWAINNAQNFALDHERNAMLCFDTSTKAACAGPAWYPVKYPNNWISNWGYTAWILEAKGRIYIYSPGEASGRIYCWHFDGTKIGYLADIHGLLSHTSVSGANFETTKYLVPANDGVACIDMATNASCTGYPITGLTPGGDISTYTIRAESPTCFWANSDAGDIWNFDPVARTKGCGSKLYTYDSFHPVNLEKPWCTQNITSWKSWTLIKVGNNLAYTSASIVFYDQNLVPIPGLAFTITSASPTANFGSNLPGSLIPDGTLRFEIKFTGLTGCTGCAIQYSVDFDSTPQVIAGTNYSGSDKPAAERFAHWTAGCGGTIAFLENVLRPLNIPVLALWNDLDACAHSSAYFPTLDMYLSHGDDPYTAHTMGIGDWFAPAAELFTSRADWTSWFNVTVPLSCKNLGRRPHEIAIGTPSVPLWYAFCVDRLAGVQWDSPVAAKEGSWVVKEFAPFGYTAGTLQAKGVWDRLEASK
ncbi:hypothetical protein DFJ74DRAFT_714407 [Hyaloraphidium curvatum]|nr:hypothetical protein DFJ74DRAFT_714407 [Hyaloraphidium curvatum]